jgi:nucleolar protein 56
MYYLALSVAGLFVFDKNNKLVDSRLFEKNPEEIAKRLSSFDVGKDIPELRELKKKYKNLVTEQPNQGSEYMKENFRDIIFKTGFVKDDAELNKLISSVSIERSKLKISKTEKRDKLIIQTVSALNDLERILNTMSERLREWYGLHYPELDVKDHEKYAELVMKYGSREKFDKFKSSMGMQLKDEDVALLQEYATSLKGLYDTKKKMETYLEKVVPEETPNLNALLGSILTARVLSLAGSLEKLAKMPSSSIQLLGAEKSLFRFLKDKKVKKPPKFGLLYIHPDISTAKKELQGKVARLLSSKLTIAARADFYTKKNMSQELLAEYKKKLEEILNPKA